MTAHTAAMQAAGSFEHRLNEWLRADVGVDLPRRVAREDPRRVLVSKFEPGFAARLHELLDLMPELFDEASVVAAYEREALEATPGAGRVDCWHTATHRMLREAGERHAIPDLRQAEVRTGIDSVCAVLQAVLWSDPRAGDAGYTPAAGEVTAYLDGLARLAPDVDLFTRTYGEFEGRLVQNHCPGASLARVMLAQGWRACTGTPPPGERTGA
ncbi:MAG: hypothetical protein GEU80_01625 [Dehalococcoidia bacterium]|nr:hypothetical protein [Dehalococcoidia bacterium]